TSIDIAERKGALLRRSLRSALRFSDEAMARALLRRKTPFSRSSASLVSITRLDQYFPRRARVFEAGLRRAAMPRNLRIRVLGGSCLKRVPSSPPTLARP